MSSPDIRAQLERAGAALKGARFAEAAELLQGLLKYQPTNFAVLTNLAGALAQLGAAR